MSYNIEDHEDELKNTSFYNLSDAKWNEMQQRIKTKAMASIEEKPAKKININYWKIAVAAASIAFILSVGFVFWQKTTTKNVTYQNTAPIAEAENPEQKLDKAINNLNEAELTYIQLLNENEISEQNEYFEN